MRPSQLLGCYFAGIFFGGSIAFTRNRTDRWILMIIWTFFSFIIMKATNQHMETTLLFQYMISMVIVETGVDEFAASHDTVFDRIPQKYRRIHMSDLSFIALYWLPCYCVAKLAIPSVRAITVNVTAILIMDYLVLWCSFIAAVSGSNDIGKDPKGVLRIFVEIGGIIDMSVYYGFKLISWVEWKEWFQWLVK